MYSLEELASYISLSEIPTSWINTKDEVDKFYNENWLDSFDFDYMLSFYVFDDEFKLRFIKEIDELKKDDKLNYLCFMFYYILYFASDKDYYNIFSWKRTKELFSNNGSDMIPVVSLLCGYEIHIKNMKERNYDQEQIDIQKYSVRSVCTNDSRIYNIDGIRFVSMISGSFLIKGKLIRIGRLQYEVGVKNFSKLDKYFDEAHEYIYIHIPVGDSLNIDEVKESLSHVDHYIKKYFKDYEGTKFAYYTQSWLLSPEVKEILPDSSNIRKFQELFNIIEYEENLDDFLSFVFNEDTNDIDFSSLKEDTTLQKELKRRILNGEKLHFGLGFIK